MGALGLFSHPVIVSGSSMEPSLQSGQMVWLDRAAYLRDLPQAGDVVVFRKDGQTYIKRVYGVPGAEVHFVAGQNDSDWVAGPVRPAHVELFRRRCEGVARFSRTHVATLRVPPGHVFVLGDNQASSDDSRAFGPIPISSLLGRVRVETDRSVVWHARYYTHRRNHG